MKKNHLQKHLNKNFGVNLVPFSATARSERFFSSYFLGGLLHLQDDLLLGLASVRSLGVLKVLVLGFKKNIWLHSQKLTATPLKIGRTTQKERIVFQPSIFRGKLAVSFRDSIFSELWEWKAPLKNADLGNNLPGSMVFPVGFAKICDVTCDQACPVKCYENPWENSICYTVIGTGGLSELTSPALIDLPNTLPNTIGNKHQLHEPSNTYESKTGFLWWTYSYLRPKTQASTHKKTADRFRSHFTELHACLSLSSRWTSSWFPQCLLSFIQTYCCWKKSPAPVDMVHTIIYDGLVVIAGFLNHQQYR